MTTMPTPPPVARPVEAARPALYGLRLSAGRAAIEVPIVVFIFVVAPFIFFLWPALGDRLDRAGVWGMVLFNAAVVLTALGIVHGPAAGGWRGMGIDWQRLRRESIVGLALIVPCYLLAALSGIVALGLAMLFGDATFESAASEKIVMVEIFGTLSPWSIVPAAVIIGITEELLFRGFLLGRLVAICRRPLVAVLISAVLFGLMHYQTQGYIGVVQTTLAGVWLGVIAWRRNSIWAAIMCHAGVDVIGLTLAAKLAHHVPELLDAAA